MARTSRQIQAVLTPNRAEARLLEAVLLVSTSTGLPVVLAPEQAVKPAHSEQALEQAVDLPRLLGPAAGPELHRTSH